jgi:hypothetical protein
VWKPFGSVRNRQHRCKIAAAFEQTGRLLMGKTMKTCKLLFLGPGLVLAFMIAPSAASAPKLTFKFTNVRVPGR